MLESKFENPTAIESKMNFFEKFIKKENKKDVETNTYSLSKDGVLTVEGSGGGKVLSLTQTELKLGAIEKLQDVLSPADIAAILLMIDAQGASVALAQADGQIPELVSALEPVAKLLMRQVRLSSSARG